LVAFSENEEAIPISTGEMTARRRRRNSGRN
jgi:hypothetical protein